MIVRRLTTGLCALWLVLGTILGAVVSAGSLQADRLVVYKSERRLDLLLDDDVVKSYRIGLGFNPVGHKQREGDGRTPEGDYVIVSRNRNSKYHRALRISYPNARDRADARKRGVSPGGDIMLHGSPNWASDESGFEGLDWTLGCIAVTNAEIREIWNAVDDGTPITIKP